jgi:tripeptidyl-peptidase-1
MKVGMRGVSVLIAAGDSGAGGNCTGAVETPDFPASSPWVTTVGGLSGGGAGAIPTHEAADTIGGGGFSDAFPQPSYQSEAVAAYLSSNAKLPPAADFHAKGRGYPE